MRISLRLCRMNLKIFTVDAFTDKPFAGNPAAVVPLEQDLPEILMQNIASELNLSETAFVRPLTLASSWKDCSRFSLRWFTPTNEVSLCGHATLATAHAIFHCLGNNSASIEFETLSGILLAKRKGLDIVLDFPSNPPTKFDEHQLSDYQPLIRSVVGEKTVAEVWLSRKTKKLLLRLNDSYTKNDLENLHPNAQELLSAHDGSEVKGVIVTLRGDLNKHDSYARGVDEYHFVSRYFAPWNGIPEDPVTGSAHTVLGPYWSDYLGLKELKCRQCSPRGGDLQLTIRDDGRVDIFGKGTTVLQGEIKM